MSHYPFLPVRCQNQKHAVVFVHGFIGQAERTWGSFPALIDANPELSQWDIFTLGYPTSGLPDIMGVWVADPCIPTIARLVATRCLTTELANYDKIAFVAHSMGGLVVQRLILDNESIANRISHLIMFGTPSSGLKKAFYWQFFKQQIENMKHGSEFISRLRKEWRERYPSFGDMPFRLSAAAGARDQFVSLDSCHADFPLESRFVVDGDHLSIAKPVQADHDSVNLVVRELLQVDQHDPLVLKSGNSYADILSFHHQAYPFLRTATYHESAEEIVAKALDLERKGYPHDAICLLRSTLLNKRQLRAWSARDRCDVMGSLGGQLKRLWLADRESCEQTRLGDVFSVSSAAGDMLLTTFCAKESFDLYSQGLMTSLLYNESEQIYYHAINIAFLALVYLQDSEMMERAATTAFAHADYLIQKNPGVEDFWAVATKAEACLYLDRFDESIEQYRNAMAMTNKPVNSDTTVIQAFVAAAELRELEWTFQLRAVLTPWATEDDETAPTLEEESV